MKAFDWLLMLLLFNVAELWSAPVWLWILVFVLSAFEEILLNDK